MFNAKLIRCATMLPVVAAASLLLAGGAQAGDVSLVGFDLYSSGSDGTNAGGGYRYTSNSNDGGAYYQQLTPTVGSPQTQAISFGLHTGSNTFDFNVGCCGSVNPGSFAGVELFFNGTGASYNPTTNGIAGDLSAFVSTSGGAFTIPTGGTGVQDFGPGGGLAAYSGATSFAVGSDVITLTALNITTTPSGSFTLFVTPEPGSFLLMGLGALAIGLVVRRRRRA